MLFLLNKILLRWLNISILEVNLNAIKNNVKKIKKFLKNNQKLCVVAKADAYGLGAKVVCANLNFVADYFAVSSSEEFFEIKPYVTKPILILDPMYENITILCKNGAELTVSNFENFRLIFEQAMHNKNIQFKFHIAVNTGMNRFGFSDYFEIEKIFLESQKMQNISICGAFTHYFDANNKKYAENQLLQFQRLKDKLALKFDLSNIIFHIANSDGIVSKNGFDMVRVGMKIYSDKLENTISLKSKIIEFQNLKQGESAGYSAVFIAKKETRLAVASIGYADGIFRNIYKQGYVLINNNFCKIVAVCMDSILVDVTNITCKLCDDVTLIGKSGDKQIFICDVASWCDTIDYEILTKISKRVKRKYIF